MNGSSDDRSESTSSDGRRRRLQASSIWVPGPSSLVGRVMNLGGRGPAGLGCELGCLALCEDAWPGMMSPWNG
jgi:hypothetical protein